MLPKTILPTFLAVVFSSISVQGTPLASPKDLAARDNKSKLFCSNAPRFLAGVNIPTDGPELEPSIPESGSDQKWFKYLWCTAKTTTYTFFDFGVVDPVPEQYFNAYAAFDEAVAQISDAESSSAIDSGPDNGQWSLISTSTNMQLQVYAAKGQTLTWAVLMNAILGLQLANVNYGINQPMVFQINNGTEGELGWGGLGMLVQDEPAPAAMNCYYEISSSGKSPCSDIWDGKVVN